MRELQNTIERAIVFGSSDMVLPSDLPRELFEGKGTGASMAKFHEALNATKKASLEKALAVTGGDLKQAAEILGLNTTYIYRLVQVSAWRIW